MKIEDIEEAADLKDMIQTLALMLEKEHTNFNIESVFVGEKGKENVRYNIRTICHNKQRTDILKSALTEIKTNFESRLNSLL